MREILEYRELFYFLVWRDVKAMYKQTALGIAWAILQPVLAMLIFTIFFGRVAAVKDSSDVPYPLFVYAGLLPWLYFAKSVSNGANSLLSNAQLVTKVYFPREIIPAVSLISSLVDFGLSFLVFLGLMVYYGFGLGWGAFAMIPLLVGISTLGLGLNLLLSALNAQFRDIRHAIPFVLQIWLFASPIIYPPKFVSDNYRVILEFNPMTGYLLGFRSALLGDPWNMEALAISVVISLAIVLIGWLYFHRVEATLADVI